jgi:hypothetical protein
MQLPPSQQGIPLGSHSFPSVMQIPQTPLSQWALGSQQLASELQGWPVSMHGYWQKPFA